LVDTGGHGMPISGTISGVLATAAANTGLRGIAFAPVPEPGAVLFGGLVCGIYIGFAACRRLVGKLVGGNSNSAARR
jgi:hypothetical protein